MGVAKGTAHALAIAAGAETAIRVRPTTDPALLEWGLRFLRECTASRARRNTLIKLRLCQYSQAVMDKIVRWEKA
jgi:D-amino-acid dehydrogenase